MQKSCDTLMTAFRQAVIASLLSLLSSACGDNSVVDPLGSLRRDAQGNELATITATVGPQEQGLTLSDPSIFAGSWTVTVHCTNGIEDSENPYFFAIAYTLTGDNMETKAIEAIKGLSCKCTLDSFTANGVNIAVPTEHQPDSEHPVIVGPSVQGLHTTIYLLQYPYEHLGDSESSAACRYGIQLKRLKDLETIIFEGQ